MSSSLRAALGLTKQARQLVRAGSLPKRQTLPVGPMPEGRTMAERKALADLPSQATTYLARHSRASAPGPSADEIAFVERHLR